MFDIGWSEMLLVAVVMILVVGPKELPGMLRSIGKTIGNLRRMAGDFQRQFNDALKEAEVDQVQKDLAQTASIPNPLDEINKSADELMNSISSDDLVEKSADNDDQIKAELAWMDANKDKAVDDNSVASQAAPTAKSTAAPAKKSAAKRTATKRTATKSTTAKTTPAKRAPAKRSAAKKPAASNAKATPAKRATKTASKAKTTAAKSTVTKTTTRKSAAKTRATKTTSKSSAKGGEAV